MQNRLPETFALLHCLFEDGFPALWPMLGLRCATSAAQWLHSIDSKLTGHAQRIIKTPSRQCECQSQLYLGFSLLFTGRLSELQACTINEHCLPEATATISNGETVADSPAQDPLDVVRLIGGQRNHPVRTSGLQQTLRFDQQPAKLTHRMETGCRDAPRLPSRR